MTYSIIGILATIILVIINRDVLWEDGKGKGRAHADAERTDAEHRHSTTRHS